MMLGLPAMPPPAPRGVGNLRGEEKFPIAAAARALADTQLRRNLGKATTTIRAKRAQVVAELRIGRSCAKRSRQLKVHTMAQLPDYLCAVGICSDRPRRCGALGSRRRRGQRYRRSILFAARPLTR